MSLVWSRLYATYSNKTSGDIDDFRRGKLEDWESINVTGTIIVDEGNMWLELEGQQSDVQPEVDAILGDNFFDTCEVMDEDQPLSSHRLDEIYTYYEDKPPITSLDD